ncbi:hypothetical protein [Cryobacterium zhongshanensis]|uniref:Uncharacterized protein n=1 Tax=Cryobacterium zhongshanensis TaxID=2928153 RepID=A0AA41QVY1_9MICO|nr:hypothetical protein [Cryobacterium zhongshanensis]MCI4658930.1 hypothetical protein [Cryobacterium zhongshanensis]
MINISSNLDDALDDFVKNAVEPMHESMAQGLAEEMRELKRASADGVVLDVATDSDDPRFQVDAERVRRRANEILADR